MSVRTLLFEFEYRDLGVSNPLLARYQGWHEEQLRQQFYPAMQSVIRLANSPALELGSLRLAAHITKYEHFDEDYSQRVLSLRAQGYGANYDLELWRAVEAELIATAYLRGLAASC